MAEIFNENTPIYTSIISGSELSNKQSQTQCGDRLRKTCTLIIQCKNCKCLYHLLGFAQRFTWLLIEMI